MCVTQDSIQETDLKPVTGVDDSGGFLRTMYEGDWLFVYTSTKYTGPNLFLKRSDFDDKVEMKLQKLHEVDPKKKYGSLMVLNRDSTLKYLGMIAEPYAMMRNVAAKPTKSPS
jgi:hypothetical protein